MPDIFVSPSKKEVKEELQKAEAEVAATGLTPPLEVEKKEESGKKAFIHKLKGHSHSPFSAFSYFPHGIKFVGMDSEEKIVLFLRRHFITNTGWILVTVLMLFAPLILKYFPILEFLPERFQFISVVGWYLLTVAFAFEKFLEWFFNVQIITDERIFDVDFVNLVYREIAEANIDEVQEVNVKMGSVVRTIFNYGDILVQTASEVPNLDFEAVPDPDGVAKVLRELRVEEEQEKLEGRVR